MKLKISVLASFFLMGGLFSCIDDESSLGGNAIPQLEIAGGADKEMPVVNFDMGVECVITPEITYKGGDEKSLTYEWSVGTYKEEYDKDEVVKGELQVVSHERVLKHYFKDGGSYYAHLKVSDGKVGTVQEYRININRTFEKGYVLVSNDEQGKGNMAFVKEMTPEELAAGKPQVYVEHCIEKMNEGMPVNNLIAVARKEAGWPAVKRLMAVTEDACYYLDPNRFTVVMDVKYETLAPGFKASIFNAEEYYPFVYDPDMKKFVHFEPEQMYLFENAKFDNAFCEDLFVGKYPGWGGVQAQSYYVKYSTSEIGQTNMNTGAFSSTQDLLKDQDILSVFLGPAFGWGKASYALTRSKAEPSKCALYKINSITDMSSGYEKKEFTATDDMALPVQGTKISYSTKNNRYYYACGNGVYVYLPSALACPNKSQFAIQYGANVEITYLDVDPVADQLFVATYDKAKKRGSFYVYDVKDVTLENQGKVTPKAAHEDCADRITSVIYKPSM